VHQSHILIVNQVYNQSEKRDGENFGEHGVCFFFFYHLRPFRNCAKNRFVHIHTHTPRQS